MAVITVFLQIDDHEALDFNLTDSIPFQDLVPLLKKHIPSFPDNFELYLRLSPEKTLADYGICNDELIFIKSPTPIVERARRNRTEEPTVEPGGRRRGTRGG